ncbi:hypothetical protein [Georgenia sp. AZ-5]|uniref:hypothetical protein n=1 Tax=Georgenia sp. AZ-5 TaxID=3367526 RepID=UPI0037552127
MLTTSLSSRTRRRTAVLLVLVLIASVVAMTVYGVVLTHRSGSPAGGAPVTADAPSAAAPAGSVPATPIPTTQEVQADEVDVVTVPATSDPHKFATSVAEAVFFWDTTNGLPPGGYTARLIEVADPTGVETPGLVADLAYYLPTPSAWEHLRRFATRQWLDVTHVAVPKQWAQAVALAPEGSLAPGTTALTVTGVRHRAGLWDNQPTTSEHEVAFTVFVVCAPTYPDCRLLRLSQLDDPLR